MSVFTRRSARYVIAAFAITACHSGSANLVTPAPVARTDWSTTLLQASQEAGSGKYAAADRLLLDFTTRYPASSEAVESMYWRALYKLDPGNPVSGARDAGVLLDGYLGSGNATHRAEALTLRRVATALESRAPAPAATAPARSEPPPNDKAKDEEIQRLKDELAKANAELERIRRRLAQPKP